MKGASRWLDANTPPMGASASANAVTAPTPVRNLFFDRIRMVISLSSPASTPDHGPGTRRIQKRIWEIQAAVSRVEGAADMKRTIVVLGLSTVALAAPARAHHEAIFGPQSSLV